MTNNISKRRNCKKCKEPFIYKVANQKFCSNTCQRGWLIDVKRKKKALRKPIVKKKKKCAYCKKPFTWSSDKPTKRYCSAACNRKVFDKKERLKTLAMDKKIVRGMTEDQKKQLIVYNDHYLTLTNYKEPLKPVKKKDGFGYYGALCSTVGGDLIQCHVCGELFKDVGKHAFQAHNMYAKEYRKEFDLAYKTALCSEMERQRRKVKFMGWLNRMTPEERAKYNAKMKTLSTEGRKIAGKTTGYKLRAETKNRRGTCPAQLLDKIKEVADKLGRTPSKFEFIGECETQRYVHLIYKNFGSWTNALKMVGMQPKERSKTNGTYRKYTDEELLEYLAIFAQEFNKIPTATDFRRGLLPSYDVYLRRWGSIENARQEAGVYEFIE